MKDRGAALGLPSGSDPLGPLPAPVSVGAGRTEVHLEIVGQGRDFVVLVTGGTAHVGAVAVCDGRADRAHVRPHGNTTQLPGHREGPLAAEAAETLAAASGRTCVAVVGIHQDDATPEEVHAIVANVRRALQELATALGQEGNQR